MINNIKVYYLVIEPYLEKIYMFSCRTGANLDVKSSELTDLFQF